MRETLSPWAEDDIARLRYQLQEAQTARADRERLAVYHHRQTDVRACKGCGYQKCSCPPEPVEEVSSVPFWNKWGQYVITAALPGSDVIGWVTRRRAYFVASFCGTKAAFGNEPQARKWVEVQHAAAGEVSGEVNR